jgi:hydroxymethylpyrimidine pyrophosphatase-like HAD family hydrolase
MGANFESRMIRLVVSDVHGTLVSPSNSLTPCTVQAVRRLQAAGIHFTVASASPAAGLDELVHALDIRAPLAILNGARIVGPD